MMAISNNWKDNWKYYNFGDAAGAIFSLEDRRGASGAVLHQVARELAVYF